MAAVCPLTNKRGPAAKLTSRILLPRYSIVETKTRSAPTSERASVAGPCQNYLLLSDSNLHRDSTHDVVARVALHDVKVDGLSHCRLCWNLEVESHFHGTARQQIERHTPQRSRVESYRRH